MRTTSFKLILILCFQGLFSQNLPINECIFISSPDFKYVVTANILHSEGGSNYTDFRLYKMPLNCSDFIKINARYPILWNKDANFFVSNIYSDCYKILLYDTNGYAFDSIMNAVSPFLNWDGIYYFQKIKAQHCTTIMKYDINKRTSEFIYQFDSTYDFFDIVTGFEPRPVLWTDTWPGGLMGVIYLNGDMSGTYTFMIKNKKLVFWLRRDYTNYNILPKEGFLTK